MRQAGTVPDQKLAERFADYLLSQGIQTKLDPVGSEWAVWVLDEKFVDQSRIALTEFLTRPEDLKYGRARDQAAEFRRAEEERRKQNEKNMIDVRQQWQSGVGSGKFPVTIACLVLMVASTLAIQLDKTHRIEGWLRIRSYSRINPQTRETTSQLPQIMEGQVWRLITPIFMHGGWVHLIFGLLMFYVFGRLIESRRGSWRLLGMILVIAATSNLAEFWLADFKDWRGGIIDPNPYFLGMSGVIYGLFGYAWMRGRYDPSSGMRLHPQTVFVLVAWLLFCLTGVMPIANVAHVVGLLVGMAIGYAPFFVQRLGFK